MNRRELLKPLAALVAAPLIVKGQEVGKTFKIDQSKRYVIFVNDNHVDAAKLADDLSGPKCPFPSGTPIVPVYSGPNMTMYDVVRIYEVTSDAP